MSHYLLFRCPDDTAEESELVAIEETLDGLVGEVAARFELRPAAADRLRRAFACAILRPTIVGDEVGAPDSRLYLDRLYPGLPTVGARFEVNFCACGETHFEPIRPLT
jgi:hypothetical protein